MPSDPSVMDMVLSELRGIRDSLHELRAEVNGKLGAHANQLAALTQWRDGHEKWAGEQVAASARAAERLEHLADETREARGAIRMLRLVGGGAVAALGLVQAWLHSGGGK